MNQSFNQFPEVIYHATFSVLLDSIKRNGLGGRGSQPLWTPAMSGLVYLSTHGDLARQHAADTYNLPKQWLNEIVLLSVDSKSLNKEALSFELDAKGQPTDTLIYRGVIDSELTWIINPQNLMQHSPIQS